MTKKDVELVETILKKYRIFYNQGIRYNPQEKNPWTFMHRKYKTAYGCAMYAKLWDKRTQAEERQTNRVLIKVASNFKTKFNH